MLHNDSLSKFGEIKLKIKRRAPLKIPGTSQLYSKMFHPKKIAAIIKMLALLLYLWRNWEPTGIILY